MCSGHNPLPIAMEQRDILLTGLAEEGSEEARRGGLVDARGANGPMGAL